MSRSRVGVARRPGQAVGRTRLAARTRARQRARRPRARRRRSLAVPRARLAARGVGARARLGLPAPLRRAAARSSSEGVDHEATVFVDGVERAHHAGAFTPFDLGGRGRRASARSRRASRAGERAAGRQDEPRARAQASHELRLGFCPRLCTRGSGSPCGSLRCAGPSPRDARGRRRRRPGRRRGGPGRRARSSGGRTGSGSRASTVSGSEIATSTSGFRTVELLDDYTLSRQRPPPPW